MNRYSFILGLLSLSFLGCSNNEYTVQTYFPIENSCKEDADCLLIEPKKECPEYECHSCGKTIIDDSNYVSVNKKNFIEFIADFEKANCDPMSIMDVKFCPDCFGNTEFIDNYDAKCIDEQCVKAEK